MTVHSPSAVVVWFKVKCREVSDILKKGMLIGRKVRWLVDWLFITTDDYFGRAMRCVRGKPVMMGEEWTRVMS
jgi:hypothetical protein